MTDLGNSTDYDTIISHSQGIRYVAEFILQTGLFGQIRHVEIEPEARRAKKTNRQDDLAMAQEVKTLSIRLGTLNTRPTEGS